VNREPTLDDLIGAETSGAERQRLQQAHELLLEAGPPPELTPELLAGPTLGMTVARRRAVKRRAMVLLAAAIAIVMVFLGGYEVANRGATSGKPVVIQDLKGTKLAPKAKATLEVWRSHEGNWPMTLTTVGLPKLPPRNYYEVYLVRDGKPWGSCGTFRVAGSRGQAVTVTLTAPYALRKGDTWIVTRPGADGSEPGRTVLHPISLTA
jgi:anti-sigma-K factor RskA